VRREEDVARLHDRELLCQPDVEAVDRTRPVAEQRRELGGAERAGRPLVGGQLPDERDADAGERVCERVQDQLPRAQRRVQRPLA
jgi:hypothetical protein